MNGIWLIACGNKGRILERDLKLMKLSVSNIGWTAGQDNQVYELMKKYGFSGLEIAPTRIFPEAPYDQLEEAGIWAEDMKKKYGFCVSSMQSIWYGRKERIFGTSEEFARLVEYTEKAINFAAAVDCRNLVFGCPGNRSVPVGSDLSTGIDFFREIGGYAAIKGTVIGLEANPPIYNTNYINDTASAFQLIDQVGSDGFRLNLDVGTMIYNDERAEDLKGKVHLINHVHISEPGLKPITERRLHSELKHILLKENYQGFVSVEMGKVEDIHILEEKMRYIKNVFG